SRYRYLFNSYYNAVGERFPRPQRGLLSRPTVEEIYRYRHFLDERLLQLLEETEEEQLRQLRPVLLLGLHHEQQHQELLLTDIKHLFALNPLRPAYHKGKSNPVGAQVPLSWMSYPTGLRWIGRDGNGFAFDNEGPRHRVFLHSFQLASRLVTNSEYLAFVD